MNVEALPVTEMRLGFAPMSVVVVATPRDLKCVSQQNTLGVPKRLKSNEVGCGPSGALANCSRSWQPLPS
jgi:hypothetical protein